MVRHENAVASACCNILEHCYVGSPKNLILRPVTCRDMSTADHVSASLKRSHALGCMHSWPTTSDDLVQIPALQSQEVENNMVEQACRSNIARLLL